MRTSAASMPFHAIGVVPNRKGGAFCRNHSWARSAHAMYSESSDLGGTGLLFAYPIQIQSSNAPSRSDTKSPFRCGEYRSEEHTSELQSLMRISYAVFCLKKKKTQTS